MNKRQRIFRTLFGVVVIGGMSTVRTVTRNGLAFQQHPIASVIGSVTPAVLLGIGYYWYTGTRMAETTWKLREAIPWVIGLLAAVALIALLGLALDDSPAGVPQAVPRHSGDVGGSPAVADAPSSDRTPPGKLTERQKQYIVAASGYDTNSFTTDDEGNYIVSKPMIQRAPPAPVLPVVRESVPPGARYVIRVTEASGIVSTFLSKEEPRPYGNGFKFKMIPLDRDITVSGSVQIIKLH
jgi:hypothetical protein